MNPFVVVCDDDPDRVLEWQKALQSVPAVGGTFEVRALSPMDLLHAIEALERRRAGARVRPTRVQLAGAAGSGTAHEDDGHPFDRAAVLIIDYDLLFVALADAGDERTPSDTGERVAYLARCYSSASLIVALNQFSSTKTFDLTLRGHLSSFADLNISSDVVDSPALWAGLGADFHPWSWPCLSREHARRERLVESLREGGIGRPILESLGLNEGPAMEAMTREHLAYLSTSGDPREATFQSFVTQSHHGLRGKDVPWNEDSVIRIAAARISKWLERMVMPGQNILVDAPHLGPRFPSLVTLLDRTPAAWNALAQRCVDSSDIPLNGGMLSGHEFLAEHWLSRPAWKWPEIARDERVPDVRNPWSIEDIAFVFCEDTSTFHAREEATEFVAEELLSEYQHRFVARLPNVRYEPEYYFAL